MLNQVEKYIQQHELFAKNDRLLVAVSGGIDSIVMLHILHALGFEIAVAHCNFKLRGKESDDDEAFVREAAAAYGIPCFVRQFETAEAVQESAGSVQMVARELRYDWFNELCDENDFSRILIGQHQDDQAETLLLNLVRGTGRTGLGGMLPLHQNVARPLLFAARTDIEAYAKANQLAFRSDSSNSDTKYRRNFMRHEVMPLLAEMNPTVAHQLAQTATHIQASNQALATLAAPILADLQTNTGDEMRIDIVKLKALQPRSFYLFELLHPLGFSSDSITKIEQTLNHIGSWFHSPTHRLLVDRKALIITPLSEEKPSREFKIEQSDEQILQPVSLSLSKHDAKNYTLVRNSKTACLDATLLEFPLTLRKWQAGDSFFPLGMDNRKLLSDFLIDNKISRLEKERTWLLMSGKNVVWVVGHRIDNRFKISDSTTTVFQADLA